MLYWGFSHKDGGVLVLMAMLLGALTLVPWIAFITLRAVAKSAAEKEAAGEVSPLL